DEEVLASIYKTRFETEGFEVQYCNNGEDALNLAKEFQPDLIMVDIMMPKMDGYDTIKSFRAIPEAKNSYIIIYSALTIPKSDANAEKYGANDFFVKSAISFEELVERVKSAIRNRESSELSDTVDPDGSAQSSD
ncbi:response regulator, partial [Candidatus Saccharibacteria bacterium]|nr:response regulator [Candidatus Saccharibacteria bacterium]